MTASRCLPSVLPLAAGLTLLVAISISGPAAADPRPSPAADTYPYAGSSGFSVSGKIVAVDGDRDLVTVQGDDGTTYTIDTLGTDIVLKPGDKSAATDDLTTDMRVQIKGTLLSGNLVAANELDVVPTASATAPVIPSAIPPDKAPAPPENDAAPGQLLPISLRGTVVAVDNIAGTFNVHINDHQRTIFVLDSTSFPNLTESPNDIPLHPGDRVTVDGKLAADGSVTASVVRMVRPIRSVHELVGLVSRPSSQYYTRDIAVKLDGGPIVKVRVWRGTAIEDQGAPVSVHSLTNNDVVRIEGGFDGDYFSATRIDVLQPVASSQ